MFTLPKRINPQAVAKQIPHLHQSPWTFFILSILITAGTLFFHTFPQMSKMEETKEGISKIQTNSVSLSQDISKSELEKEKLQQKLIHFEEKYKPRIDKVFPAHEGITEMTRFLEKFSLQLEKTGLITLTTISYGGSKSSGDFLELPIRLSFQANNVNFVRFMQMVKHSGSIEDKDFYDGNPVRLMQVNRISVSIPKLDDSISAEEQLYSISLELSAFYHSPDEV